MNVYIVATKHRDGQLEQGIFSTAIKAQQYIDNNGLSCSYWLEMPVIGEQVDKKIVFSASIYDCSLDEHFFDKVYGSYDLAANHSGQKAMVLRRVIDEKLE